MPENHRYSQSYLQFLKLLKTARGVAGFVDLDPLEERLLNSLAMVWHADEQITVTKTIGSCNEVSSTTVQSRLKSLRKKGLIDLVMDEIDNRIKYVMPTTLACQYFAQLGQCLEDAKAT
jgi:DNA-binding MarR family transcriptional regulator